MFAYGALDLRHVAFEGCPARWRRTPAIGRAAHEERCSHGSLGTAAARDDAPAEGFPAFVLERAGVDARGYRDRPLQRRSAACLRALRCTDEDEARDLISRRPERVAVALNALLIGVTEPFRDEQVFESIRQRVLPRLASRPRLRVWSAGCANGAELMSAAALLAEAGLLEKSVLLGTDCRAEAIAEAAAGVWSHAVFPAGFRSLRHAFFEPVAGGAWRPLPRLLAGASWKQADLTLGLEPGPWDLVLCRNLGIYLTPAVAGLLTERLAATLAPGGFLIVGKAERPSLPGLVPVDRCVYWKVAGFAG